jgi:NAD(P)H dehydrogenase (quinone)
MNIFILLAHPRPGSLNHAIAQATCSQLEASGHLPVLHDLYAEHFNPLLQPDELPKDALLPELIQTHGAEIQAADGIIIIHPNWFGMPPAILTGWVDRVLRAGVAYEFIGEDGGEGVPRGLLKARNVLVLNTSDTPPEREQAMFGDPLERIWKDCVFGLCGDMAFHRQTFGVVVTSTEAERVQWLAQAKETVRQIFPAP